MRIVVALPSCTRIPFSLRSRWPFLFSWVVRRTRDNTTTSSSSGGGGGAAVCTPTSPITCEDQVVQDMDLKNNVAPDSLPMRLMAMGFGRASTPRRVDFMYTDSYVYAKFTDKGLKEAGLDRRAITISTDWDYCVSPVRDSHQQRQFRTGFAFRPRDSGQYHLRYAHDDARGSELRTG